ncbi:MAG TPA: phosphatidylserine decarboxylase family protein [Chitinophagales bacterium]|jgi:phosphatidylserine decarboxylase|nr:phosphatidylserine decarboxylase family protein [Chitinophagales bacterium]HPA34816.1 phosphatidylserine decarboxylase family protein [Chitinophagales bacterium]HPW85773.1 phosphatidylserine decarboxylase family protein [Chitinophagales bacterium]HQD12912.1 phosphatidylserine decarboxylase family protein [Chitinophagales bacterium]HQO31229.1 phosphatidylserine decarboxylase family protein [Chitinophagales bacterium]
MKRHYIHKEGWKIVLGTFLAVLAINLITNFIFNAGKTVSWFIFAVTFSIFAFVTYFFRNPKRNIITDDDKIICPADGKVVVIEEVYEPEYFEDKRLQVSVFMSPANVHVNRAPIAGEVKYSKYHDGKYLVAWHPKSSTENERTSLVIDNGSVDVLVRQIAGKVARRIVYYLNEGDTIEQGADFGFIKFGSRVDMFLPLDTKINVQLGQKVKGGITIIGELPK